MIEQLNSAFKDIVYYDKEHKYFVNKKPVPTPLISVTQFIGKLKRKFNAKFWSTFKAYQFSGYDVKFIWNNYLSFKVAIPDSVFGSEYKIISIYDDHSHLSVTPEDVLAQWNIDNIIGTSRGSYIHQYLENVEQRRLDEPTIDIPPNLNIPQTISYVQSLKVAKELIYDFVEYSKKNLVLIACEYIVGDEKLGIAGTFDRLYFNKNTEEYEIWDFKTDKKLNYKSSFGKIDLFNLPDCEYEKYSIQTSLYKSIILRNCPNIKLGKSRIVWFSLKDEKYEIIECNDYTDLITDLSHETNWNTYINTSDVDK